MTDRGPRTEDRGPTSGLVSLDQIQAAATRLRGMIQLTAMVEITGPTGQPLSLKCENLQLAGAFKIRGASNMITQLTDAQRSRGVITYSSGNHGQAVALAARRRAIPAVIVMPRTAPAVKVDGVRELGGEIILEGTTSTERKRRAELEAGARGLTIVPPFDHEWIIAGQGTLGLEILAQCPDVSTVYIPIGGGGLIAGVAAALKQSVPGIRVVGVEPEGAASMGASIRAGHPVTLEKTHSVADGLLPVRPGDATFQHVQAFVDDLVTVSDSEIVAAVVWLFRRAKLVVEPSGAAAVAAAYRSNSDGEAQHRMSSKGGRRVAILSGGNIAADSFCALAAS